jgi:hypothetical protein
MLNFYLGLNAILLATRLRLTHIKGIREEGVIIKEVKSRRMS